MSEIIREVAGGDYEKAQRIYRTWPMVEVLIAYSILARERAEREYYVSLITWAAIKPHTTENVKQPERPAILDRRFHGDP